MEKVLEKLETLNEGEVEKSTRVNVQSKSVYVPRRPFLPGKVKEIIGQVLREKLTNVQYDGEQAPYLVREIADMVKQRARQFEFERYKIVVQAVIGETRGQGLQMASRCFWDKDMDDYARDTFQSDNLFGIAVCFGIYMY